jgi:hypothetical protein
MRRAVHQVAVSGLATPPAPSLDSPGGSYISSVDFADKSERSEVFLSAGGAFAKPGDMPNETLEHDRRLAIAIMQRIETRLPGRVRNLAVRIKAETVVLEGQCATYYTKQLAQHAALGILEDEHLENAIAVTIGR